MGLRTLYWWYSNYKWKFQNYNIVSWVKENSKALKSGYTDFILGIEIKEILMTFTSHKKPSQIIF